jgi:hypothetical protein
VRARLRRRLQRLDDDRLDVVVGDLARGANARLVIEALEPELARLRKLLRERTPAR